MSIAPSLLPTILLSLLFPFSLLITKASVLQDIDITTEASSTNTRFLYGPTLNGQFGYSVGSAGDINADGIDDFLIGMGQENIGSGRVYVVYGQKGGIPSIDFSAFTSSQGFWIQGEAPNDNFGSSANRAGDFNDDGIDDIIIGAVRHNSLNGAVYIIYGQKGIIPNMNLPGGLAGRGFKVSGSSSAYLGMSVACAGDINSDGVDDIIFGGHLERRYAVASGSVYVIFGKKLGRTDLTVPSGLTSDIGFQIQGHAFDSLGSSVSTAGDFNADGIDDILFGAYAWDPNVGRSDPGDAYVLYGRKTGLGYVDLTLGLNPSQGFRIHGVGSGDVLGFSVKHVGDFNGDKIDDIIVGGYSASGLGRTDCGAAYVIFGRKGGYLGIDLANGLKSAHGFAIYGSADYMFTGYAVSGAGDINGDGLQDVVIGDIGVASSATGGAYVLFGRKIGNRDIDLKDGLGTQGFKITGTQVSSYLGRALGRVRDINSDGADDIIIGAYTNINQNGIITGSAHIVYGIAFPLLSVLQAIVEGQEVADVAIKTTAAVTLISKFNNGQLLLFSFLAEMMNYVKYLQITYPPRLRYILEQPEPEFISIDYISSFPEELQEYFTKSPLPTKFEFYEFHSSFLINFWPSMVMLIIITLSIVVSMVLVSVTKSCKSVHDKLLHLKQALKWNYIIAVFTGYYTDTAIFTSLEMRTAQLDTILGSLSFSLCVLVNIMIVFVLIKIFLVLHRLRKAKKATNMRRENVAKALEGVKAKLRDYEVVFDSYKENSFAQQLYFLLFGIRLYLFYVIVSYLFEYPLVQMIIINVLGVFTLIYLGVTRPFKERTEMVVSALQEFILQIVHISALVLAITDKGDNDTEDVRVVFGDIIIGCNVAFLLISLIFTFITLVIFFKDIFKIIRAKCMKKTRVLRTQKPRQPTENSRLNDVSRVSEDVSALNESQIQLNSSVNGETTQNGSARRNYEPRSRKWDPRHELKQGLQIADKDKESIFKRSRVNYIKKPEL